MDSTLQKNQEQSDEVNPEGLKRNGYILTNKEVRDARYAVCKSCPKLRPMIKTCKDCGCFMPAKTWLKDTHCPDYWW